MTVGELFAGIGGFGLGLERAGARVAWQVEINEQARAVLARHWPKTARYEDVREVGAGTLEAVDVVAGGFPCQDLSVAGRRAGLGGERSGLWWEFHRIVSELRPRWVVAENVPGLLSAVCPCPGTGQHRIKREILDAAVERIGWERVWCDEPHQVPGGYCGGGRCMQLHGGAMGTVLGSLAQLGYGYAYRVLDARFFGLAQRRARVLIVGCLGDARRAAQVLLEPEGVRGDLASRGEARADVAGPLGSQPAGGGWRDDLDRAGAFIAVDLQNGGTADLCGTIQSEGQATGNRGYAVLPIQEPTGRAGTVGAARDGTGIGAAGDPMFALQAGKQHGVAIAHTLTSGGFDASEDGSGRGVPLVASAVTAREGKGPDSDATTTLVLADPICANEARTYSNAGNNPRPRNVVPVLYQCQGSNVGPAGALRTGHNHTNGVPFVGVRRLTPTECERLQGFPDGWTAESIDGPQSDSARYRQLGNAVPPPMVEWVGRRIVRANLPETAEAVA